MLDGASSRPMACLTLAGISIPIVAPEGGVYVIGDKTVSLARIDPKVTNSR